MLKALAAVLAFLPLPALADDDGGLGGVWQGADGPTSYTRLIVKDDANVTYCFMRSCHELACSDWNVSGSTNGEFSYSGPTGSWTFTRVGPDRIDGVFRNRGGDAFHVSYEPE